MSNAEGTSDRFQSSRREIVDVPALDELWLSRWPGSVPIAHELKGVHPTQWVRIHTLPNAKRYAETEIEYLTILSRHNSLLTELCAEVDASRLIVVACGYGDSRQPQQVDTSVDALLPNPVLWQVVADDDYDDPGYTYVWADVRPWTPGGLDNLLRAVADGEVSGVMIVPCGLDWIYHPYDGGADIIALDLALRSRIETRHADWLSSHPRGL